MATKATKPKPAFDANAFLSTAGVAKAIVSGGTYMRIFILTLVMLAGVLAIPTAHVGTPASSGPAFGAVVLEAHSLDAEQAPSINIEVNKGGGRAWYANPVWIAIGVLGLLVVVVLIVMAAKGGGTTVVKG